MSNVIATKDVSENLLSLRKLADSGFSIYLDDETLRVYDKKSNKTIFEGVYNKPNWEIEFEVRNNYTKNNSKEVKYDMYCCRAKIRKIEEINEQSQENIKDQKSLEKEGEEG